MQKTVSIRTGAQADEGAFARETIPRGTTLGRYVVLDRLGAGGMGVVYSAYDYALDRRVALKFLRADRDDGRQRESRLLREAKAMARLAHPNVLVVHDVGHFGERVFIAMEHVDGPTLSRWLSEGRRSAEEILEMFSQAAEGLSAAHATGLVHGDFKPENVLIGRDGRVRVSDFGLAHSSPQDCAGGTRHYMAPEQTAGGADARSDQYSFCVALEDALSRAKRNGGAVNSKVARAVARGKCSDSVARHPSMKALIAALEPKRSQAQVAWLALSLVAAAFLAIKLNPSTVKWMTSNVWPRWAQITSSESNRAESPISDMSDIRTRVERREDAVANAKSALDPALVANVAFNQNESIVFAPIDRLPFSSKAERATSFFTRPSSETVRSPSLILGGGAVGTGGTAVNSSERATPTSAASLLVSGSSYQLLGATDNGFAIAFDAISRSVSAISTSGQGNVRPIVSGEPVVGSSSALITRANTALLFYGADAANSTDTSLALWSSATGAIPLAADAFAEKAALSDDGQTVAYLARRSSDSTRAALVVQSLADLQSKVILSDVNIAVSSRAGCVPDLAFAGSKLIFSSCFGAHTSAAVRSFDPATGMATDLIGVSNVAFLSPAEESAITNVEKIVSPPSADGRYAFGMSGANELVLVGLGQRQNASPIILGDVTATGFTSDSAFALYVQGNVSTTGVSGARVWSELRAQPVIGGESRLLSTGATLMASAAGGARVLFVDGIQAGSGDLELVDLNLESGATKLAESVSSFIVTGDGKRAVYSTTGASGGVFAQSLAH